MSVLNTGIENEDYYSEYQVIYSTNHSHTPNASIVIENFILRMGT